MSEKYATTVAKISCPNLQGSITITEFRNRKVKAEGNPILTCDGAKITCNGSCQFLTNTIPQIGVPKPCPCKMSSTLAMWLGFSKNSACGSKMLLESSKIFCNVAGVQLEFKTAGTNKTFQGNSISLSPIPPVSPLIITPNEKFNAPEHSFAEKISSPEKIRPNLMCKSSGGKCNNRAEFNVPEHSFAEKISSPEKIRPNLICKGRGGKYCADCKYWSDRRETVPSGTNSKKLRDNYNAAKNHDEYDLYFDKVVAPNEAANGWSDAAHHIISGEQVFKNFPELVKLAELCNYDINCYENCIMLIGKPDNYGTGDATQSPKELAAAKSSDADLIMRDSGLQWHVAHHRYSFTNEEATLIRRNFKTYLSKRNDVDAPEIKCYADLVTADVEALLANLKLKPVCFRDNPQNFIDAMNKLSQSIKAKLAAFQDKPQHSYPYYVSKEAYLYAFGIPHTTSFFLVSRVDSSIRFTQIRATRYRSTLQDDSRGLTFELKDSATFESLSKECVKFLAGTVYFVLDGATEENLPFLKPVQKNCGTAYFLPLKRDVGESDENFLNRNGRRILIWLREVVGDWETNHANIGASGIVRARIKELNSGNE